MIAFETEPDRVFRKKWWFRADEVICRTYGTDNRERCMKIRGGDGRIDLFTPAGAFHRQARVLQGNRLPETSRAQKGRAAEIARLKQQGEIERLKIERLKAQAEIARLKRAAETPSKPAPQPSAPARRGAGEDRMERALWAYAKGSRDPADAEAYLDRYPSGRFAADAEARIKALSELSTLQGIDFGTYHALVIGNDDYKHLPDLQTAVNDARAVAKVLAFEYGFKVSTLINATRADIVEALDGYRESMTENDNLLIYYAGHGWLDKDVNRGYWLPVDARRNRRTNWVSNATISDTLTAVLSKHVMVVADSCYSGTLARGAGVKLRSGDYWRRMARKRTRVALTSGGLEPVVDKGGGGHSPFAGAFIKSLKGNTGVIDGTQLFGEMRRRVMVNADQTPEYSDVRNTGHDGGDFLFIRKF